ncbi:MAG: glycerophosphoryl diester phosphodiesterase membrane domain-containing protein [Chloroflexota bacterium]
MTTAVSPLQPLGMGQLLDRAIRLYRQNFLTFIGIVAITQIPTALFSIFLSLAFAQPNTFLNPNASPQAILGLFGTTFFTVIVSAILTQIATGALTVAVSNRYLGEKVGVLEAYRRLKDAWKPLLGALVVAFLVGVGLLVWTIVPCIGWFTGGGMMTFFGLVVMPLVAPVVVLEKQSSSRAVFRAWQLARRRFWWLLGFLLLLTLFGQLFVTGPALLTIFLIGGASTFGQVGDITAVILQQTVSVLFSMLYLPIQLTAVTLLYFDVRVRTEGFDLALLAKGDEAITDITDLTVPPKGEAAPSPTPTSTELGYFAMMSIGFFVIYIALVAILFAIGFAISGLG